MSSVNVSGVLLNFSKTPIEVREGFKAGYEMGLRFYLGDVYLMLILFVGYCVLLYLASRRNDKYLLLFRDLFLVCLGVQVFYTLVRMLVLKLA